MKLLCVSPGSYFSTADVFRGLWRGIKALDDDAECYDLERVIVLKDSWMRWVMTRGGKAEEVPPLFADHTLETLQGTYAPYLNALRDEVLDQLLVVAYKSRPDWIVLVSGYQFTDEHLAWLDGIAPTAVVFTESPYEDERQERQAALVTQVFTNDRGSVARLSLPGRRPAQYLPAAFDPLVHYPSPGSSHAHDVVFVGMGFTERIAYLEAIDWTGIDLGLYGDWRYLAADSPLRGHVHQGIIANHEAAELYRSSRIGLNLFRSMVNYWQDEGEAAEGESMNPRSYELAACGVCQVSNWRPEAVDVFGDAALAFADPAEAEVVIRNLLADPTQRQGFADRQRARVQEHSYNHRARALMEVLSNA